MIYTILYVAVKSFYPRLRAKVNLLPDNILTDSLSPKLLLLNRVAIHILLNIRS